MNGVMRLQRGHASGQLAEGRDRIYGDGEHIEYVRRSSIWPEVPLDCYLPGKQVEVRQEVSDAGARTHPLSIGLLPGRPLTRSAGIQHNHSGFAASSTHQGE